MIFSILLCAVSAFADSSLFLRASVPYKVEIDSPVGKFTDEELIEISTRSLSGAAHLLILQESGPDGLLRPSPAQNIDTVMSSSLTIPTLGESARFAGNLRPKTYFVTIRTP